MKFTALIVYMSLNLLTAFNAQAAVTDPVVVPVSYKNIYVPNGFDTNDSVQLVADGIFSNACYKIAQPRVWVEDKKRVINIEPRAYQYSGACAMVLIPFQQTIEVGIISSPGRYDITDGDGKVIGNIDIKPATSSLEDDFLYAPVHKVTSNEANGSHNLTIKIEFSQSCMKMKEVKVTQSENVIVVQPIARIIPGPCAMGYFPVTETVDLGPLDKNKRFLIHVRSSGSQALNEIIINESNTIL
jgi:hypothetical protein